MVVTYNVWSRIEDNVNMGAESCFLRTKQECACFWPFTKFLVPVM